MLLEPKYLRFFQARFELLQWLLDFHHSDCWADYDSLAAEFLGPARP
jgi:hypothetical protein